MSRPAPRKSALTGVSPFTAPAPATVVSPQAPAATAPQRKPAARPPAATLTGERGRIGIYLTADQFADAKSAFLGDWQAGGDADALTAWIAGVIETHAQRSPAERAALGREPKRSSTTVGGTRSFVLPMSTIDAMRDAQADDQAAGRFVSDSHWCGEAISVAVDDARERAGGQLPPAPARLPSKLVRRNRPS